MDKQEGIQMDKEFLIWYKEVCLDCTPEILQKRWDSISSLLEKLSWKDVESLLRIVFKTKQLPSHETLELIKNVLTNQDETFEFDRSQREIEVLCGAALSTLCKINNPFSAVATLGILNTSLNRCRVPECPIDLISIAQNNMNILSERTRERPDFEPEMSLKIQSINIEPYTKKIQEAFDSSTVVAALLQLNKTTNTTIQSLQNQIHNIFYGINNFLAAQDEELQMLWWLMGSRSWDLNCQFSEIPPQAKPFVLAKELAALTTFCPGRLGTKALLIKAGIDDKLEVSIKDAINSCDMSWIKSLVGQNDFSPVTTPLHSALKCFLETEDRESWANYWGASTKVSPESTHLSLALSFQFYCERLLLHFSETIS